MTPAVIETEDLRRRFAPLYTGALADVLYELGLGAQTLPPTIKPLIRGDRVVGPAFTVQWQPYVTAADDPEIAWEMLAAVPAGHVAVNAAVATDRSALGDLAMAFLKAQGAAGVVVDGGCRDITFNEEIGLPTFCAFTTPQDLSHGRGTVTGWGEEIRIGEVRIAPGDFVVGDADGVVIVPVAVITEVLTRAETLVARETRIRAALVAGQSPAEAFAANP